MATLVTDPNNLVYWIWLSKIPTIGIKTRRLLLEAFDGDPRKIYEADEEEYGQISQIGSKRARNIVNNKSLDVAERILDKCIKNHISILTLEDDAYPAMVKEIEDMPTHLYYKGTPRLSPAGVAIVGARRCTRPGKEKAVSLATELARQGITVISGMAKGIDSYAHTACLKAGGYTVAVLANGLDRCYPNEHRLLQQRIEEGGLLLSQYEPGEPPRKAYFPQRNRIIAACAREVCLVDTGTRSGAYITRDYAIKYGRKVTYGVSPGISPGSSPGVSPGVSPYGPDPYA